MAIGTPTVIGGSPIHNATDAVTTWSFSSVTPNVGDLLVVSAEHIFTTGGLSPTTISASNTGFGTSGWSQVSVIATDNIFDLRTSFLYAIVTSSAAGVVTITRDGGGSAFWLSYGIMFSITGVDTASPVIQSNTGSSAAGGGPTSSVTLGSALTPGSALITNVFDANGVGAETQPSGYTTLTDRLENGDGFYTAYHLSPSSTTAAWSGLQSGLAHQQCLVELRPYSPGVSGLSPFPRRKLITKAS